MKCIFIVWIFFIFRRFTRLFSAMSAGEKLGPKFHVLDRILYSWIILTKYILIESSIAKMTMIGSFIRNIKSGVPVYLVTTPYHMVSCPRGHVNLG